MKAKAARVNRRKRLTNTQASKAAVRRISAKSIMGRKTPSKDIIQKAIKLPLQRATSKAAARPEQPRRSRQSQTHRREKGTYQSPVNIEARRLARLEGRKRAA